MLLLLQIIAIFISCLSIVDSKRKTNSESDLMEKLVKSYPGMGITRPVLDVAHTMNITFAIQLNELVSLNERSGVMTISAVAMATWHDTYLQWDPSAFEEVDAIPVRSSDIFLPKIIPIGAAGDLTPVFDGTSTTVWVDSDGIVSAKATANFDTSCKMELANFPLDTQKCSFYFKTLRLKKARIALQLGQNSSILSHSTLGEEDGRNANPYWSISSIESHETVVEMGGAQYSVIVCTISATRRANYYLRNILLPSFAMAAVQLSVLMMPFESQRAMFAITSVLVLDIFQASVKSKLGDSEPIPVENYSMAQLIMGIFLTIESVLIMQVILLNKYTPVPRWLNWMVREQRRETFPSTQQKMAPIRRENCSQITIPRTSSIVKTPMMAMMGPGDEMHNSNTTSLVATPLQFCNPIETCFGHLDTNKIDYEPQWQALARIIDRIVLFGCILVIAVMPVLFFRL